MRPHQYAAEAEGKFSTASGALFYQSRCLFADKETESWAGRDRHHPPWLAPARGLSRRLFGKSLWGPAQQTAPPLSCYQQECLKLKARRALLGTSRSPGFQPSLCCTGRPGCSKAAHRARAPLSPPEELTRSTKSRGTGWTLSSQQVKKGSHRSQKAAHTGKTLVPGLGDGDRVQARGHRL